MALRPVIGGSGFYEKSSGGGGAPSLDLSEGSNTLAETTLSTSLGPSGGSPNLVLPADSGKWLVVGTAKYQLNGATFTASRTITTALWNSAGAGEAIFFVPDMALPTTTTSNQSVIIPIFAVLDMDVITPGVGAEVTIAASISTLPSAGNIQLHSWSLIGTRIQP
jgi:hypothetical protein